MEGFLEPDIPPPTGGPLRFGTISSWLGGAGLCFGTVSAGMLAVLVIDMRLPDVLIPTFMVLLALSIPLGFAGLAFAIVSLVRREGARSFVALGLALLAFAPIVVTTILSVGLVSLMD